MLLWLLQNCQAAQASQSIVSRMHLALSLLFLFHFFSFSMAWHFPVELPTHLSIGFFDSQLATFLVKVL